MEQKIQERTKFNWKLVVISLCIIIILYFAASYFINKDKTVNVVYCKFEKELLDSVPRNECGILKIVSDDFSLKDFDMYEELDMKNACSKKLGDVGVCEGENYHWAAWDLKSFCTEKPCDVKGVICTAFFVTYYEDDLLARSVYEEMFLKTYLNSSEEVMGLLAECDV